MKIPLLTVSLIFLLTNTANASGCLTFQKAEQKMKSVNLATESVTTTLDNFMRGEASSSNASNAVDNFQSAATNFYKLYTDYTLKTANCDSLQTDATTQIGALNEVSNEVKKAIMSYDHTDQQNNGKEMGLFIKYPMAIAALGGVFFKAVNNDCLCTE